MALESILNLAADIANEREEKKQAKIVAALDLASADYLRQRGEPARDWIQKIIQQTLTVETDKVPPLPLDDATVASMVNHIANGHFSNLKELLWAELAAHGYPKIHSQVRATSVFLNLCWTLTMAMAAAPDAETGTLGSVSKKELQRLNMIALGNKQRITCPHCYRSLREWDASKNAPDFGPRQVQCKQCNQVVFTFLTPWGEATAKQKFSVFIWPTLFIVGSVVAMILFKDLACVAGSGVGLLVGILWAFRSWQQGRESLKTPVW